MRRSDEIATAKGDWPDLQQWIAEARQKAQEPFVRLAPEDLRCELKDAEGAEISVIPIGEPWTIAWPPEALT